MRNVVCLCQKQVKAMGMTVHRHPVGGCVVGIESARLREQTQRLLQAVHCHGGKARQTSQVAIVGIGVAGGPTPSAHYLGPFHPRRNGPDYLLCDLILKLKNILQRAVKAVCPYVGSTRRVDQLSRNSQSTSGPAHAAFQYISNAPFATHAFYINRFTLVTERRVPSDDEQRFEPRQRCSDVFGHTISEILLLGIAANVLKRKYRNGRFVRDRRQVLRLSNMRGRGVLRFIRRTHLIRSDRLKKVLHMLNTKVLKGDRQDLAYLLVCRAGDTHASRLRNRL